MNKKDLIAKYKHQLILKNFSENTINSYINGLNLFLKYVQKNSLNEVSSQVSSERQLV